MNEFLAQFGAMGWPLLMCSFLSVLIILERLIFLLLYSFASSPSKTLRIVSEYSDSRPLVISEVKLGLGRFRQASSLALETLSRYAGNPKDLREEALTLWLKHQQKKLLAYLKWLSLIAVISPLLGLLGTVIGMIQAFQNLAAHTGPVHPALVADGLQQAMFTTAAGLAIAIPALIAASAYRLWVSNIIEHLEFTFNRVNLAMQGLPLAGSAVDDNLNAYSKQASIGGNQ